MSLPLETLGWAASWVLGGAIFVLLVRRGVTYVDYYGVTAIYFALATVAVAVPFRHVLLPLAHQLRPIHAVLLAIVVGLHVWVYRWLPRRIPRPEALIRAYPHVYWLRLDPRYNVSKPFEILFQQVLFIALVLILAGTGWNRLVWNGALIVMFGALHVPIIPMVGRYFGLYYLWSSMVAALVFPAVILAAPDGFVYAYLLHWLYYLASSIYFWMRPPASH
ncbi:MAG: hypothetical protein KC729_02365 [Candidatus Eisenbacteria bacterium]|uniref:Uncharacterized protein n=1 Tax=Eiseniibacteriota bacterium TaxID=2212470 RepID=A0A956LVJ4_UNCEI|nr:hypothetical protein [Candidatus Eisenbacteria bacterium]